MMTDVWMIDLWTVSVLGLLMVGTYATRILGYILVQHMNLTHKLDRVLRHVPGTVFAALLAPVIVRSTPTEWIAALGAAIIFGLCKSLFAALCAGAITAAVLRLVDIL